MSQQFTIELPTRAIAALTLLQAEPNQLGRNGICVEITRTSSDTANVLLVALDGRVFGCYHANECFFDGNLPPERGRFVCDFSSALKVLDKKSPAWVVEVTLAPEPTDEKQDRQPHQIKCWDMGAQRIVSGPSIVAPFPNWRAAMPQQEPQPMHGLLNAEYVALFAKVQKALGKPAEGGMKLISYPTSAQPGETQRRVACFAVHLPHPDFFGIIMPMHQKDETVATKLPRWIA